MNFAELARMPRDQLANLDADRARHLDLYRAGRAAAAQSEREREAADRTLAQRERMADRVQAGLGVAGEVPVVGAIADLGNAAISAGRGDRVGAAMDLSAAIPGPTGATAGAAGVARRIERAADASGDVARNRRSLDGDRLDHVLSRHQHGANQRGASEFPASWTADRIRREVEGIANSPHTRWSQPGRNGYVTTNVTRDGIEVRVVVDPSTNEVVTAYPTNLPRN